MDKIIIPIIKNDVPVLASTDICGSSDGSVLLARTIAMLKEKGYSVVIDGDGSSPVAGILMGQDITFSGKSNE